MYNSKYRDTTLASLSTLNIGVTLKVSGWVFRKRDHGSILFIDLRDRYGILQVVVDESSQFFKDACALSYESVISITGKLTERSPSTKNPSLQNGEVELILENLEVLSTAIQLPIPIESNFESPEELRLKFRYLDLRRAKMKNNLLIRAKVISHIRKFMEENGFIEFHTPILTASSPEGARDYLVPSRVHKGKFYALPQAPQQFKQLLMVSGFDRYYQIAPCFRDEDSRADRSPGEFYQLDLEMSFVDQEDIILLMEKLLHELFSKFSNKKIDETFPRISYADSMLLYCTDKPDLRNPIKLCDLTHVFSCSSFEIFKKQITSGAVVRGIPAPLCGSKSRKFFDDNIGYAVNELKAGGLAYVAFENGIPKGPIAKFLSEENIQMIKESASLKENDAIFFSCDKKAKVEKIASEMRKKLGYELQLINDNEFKFCWIVDFPYFERDEQTGALDFSHNPFSMPKGEMSSFEKDPLEIISQQYDIVCNGIELSSGAVRNHKPEIMYKAFSMLGFDQEYVNQHFSALVESFKYGAPPHAGIAPGIDRMVMLLLDEENIREVIAFPMNQKCEDLLMGAPSFVDEKRLQEIGIALSKNSEKK